MIFQTKRLTQLKDLQSIIRQNHPEIYNSNFKIDFKTSANTFSELVQNIGVEWMKYFIKIIEQWISNCCQKFVRQLSTIQSIDPYSAKFQLNHMSQYLEQVKHKFSTSLENMNNLYLMIPSDHKNISNNKSSAILIQRKKSISIQSIQKSRSKSKGRKISFFTKKNDPPNLFETFLKDKTNLNKTIKKGRKQSDALRSNQFYRTHSHFLNQSNSSVAQNKENSNIKQIEVKNYLVGTDMLKRGIQQKLCNSTFESLFGEKMIKKLTSSPRIQNNYQFQQQKSQKQLMDVRNQVSSLQQKLNIKIEELLKQIKKNKISVNQQSDDQKVVQKQLMLIIKQGQKLKAEQLTSSQQNKVQKCVQQKQEKIQRKSDPKKSTNIGLKDNSIIKKGKLVKNKKQIKSGLVSHIQNQNQIQTIQVNKVQKEEALLKIDSKAKLMQPQNKLMRELEVTKNKMENRLQSFQKATRIFALPINQMFLSILKSKYMKFCHTNNLKNFKDEAKTQNLPQNQQKFIIQSLQKLQKMLKMKLNQQKRQKLIKYIKECSSCILQVYLPFKNQAIFSQMEYKIQSLQKLYQKV